MFSEQKLNQITGHVQARFDSAIDPGTLRAIVREALLAAGTIAESRSVRMDERGHDTARYEAGRDRLKARMDEASAQCCGQWKNPTGTGAVR